MGNYKKLRFVLGIVRHPSQAWRRIREMKRVTFAPSMSIEVPSDVLADVDVTAVTADASLQKTLVAMYVENPSPFVHGPKSVEQLQDSLDRSIHFFLVVNSDGDYVGACAFDANRQSLQNTVTDFRHRGNGYQLAASKKLIKLLASEGYTTLHAAVLRTNTRIQRSMQAAGWDLEPDSENPDLMRGTLRLDG